MGTGFIDRVLVQVKEERKITMKYNLLDHKRMWVEKLEEDLEQLELLGHNKTSTVVLVSNLRQLFVETRIN